MASETQMRAAVDRCLSALATYHDFGPSHRASEYMRAEIHLVVGFLLELNLLDGDVESAIIRPVQGKLIERYGHELGPRLFGEFVNSIGDRLK